MNKQRRRTLATTPWLNGFVRHVRPVLAMLLKCLLSHSRWCTVQTAPSDHFLAERCSTSGQTLTHKPEESVRMVDTLEYLRFVVLHDSLLQWCHQPHSQRQPRLIGKQILQLTTPDCIKYSRAILPYEVTDWQEDRIVLPSTRALSFIEQSVLLALRGMMLFRLLMLCVIRALLPKNKKKLRQPQQNVRKD